MVQSLLLAIMVVLLLHGNTMADTSGLPASADTATKVMLDVASLNPAFTLTGPDVFRLEAEGKKPLTNTHLMMILSSLFQEHL